LLGLYAPILFADSDSARIVAAVTHVQHHGIGFLRDTQDNLLPHVLLGPAIAARGLAGAKFVTIVSTQVCVGVTAYVTRRITGSMWGALVAALSLVAIGPMLDRAVFLAMYPTMLALGYMGSWLAYRTITEPDHRWRTGLAAGACLALVPEAQPVGVLFLPVPVLLLVFASRWQSGAAALGRVYGALAVVSIPRLAINLSEGGLSHLASYRTDYWITKGYVREIQVNFWKYLGVNESLDVYLDKLPVRFLNSLESYGWALLVVAAAGWLLCSTPRARLFVLTVVGFVFAAVTLKRIPPFARYYSPTWPGVAILVGVAGASLARQRAWLARGAAAVGTGALIVVATTNLTTKEDFYQASYDWVARQPYTQLATLITDGKGVIGARSHGLVNVRADIPTWGGQFLTEDEYVTYLTWPSDDAVIEVMRRHNIGWVLIGANRILETSYHDTWLVPHYGKRARQVDAVAASPAFCLRADIGGFRLYQLGPCASPPDRASGGDAPPA
jgi:hypothetical protein